MDYSKSLTLSEYLAGSISAEELPGRIAAGLAVRLPDGVTVDEVWERRPGFWMADCEGIATVLDLIDVAAALDCGVMLSAEGDRQVGVVKCWLPDGWVEIVESFPFTATEEAEHG
ncbi:hypothetical protein [Glycomyces xiaoerkulensis]|uniref:hypothetical protein n=1 Tax=Glycomyces xiaoerkulensis TaxID=2038139 RepID=UPI000C257E66|nr:hypothetical protein [Glycomyces xiaoerkulensis]